MDSVGCVVASELGAGCLTDTIQKLDWCSNTTFGHVHLSKIGVHKSYSERVVRNHFDMTCWRRASPLWFGGVQFWSHPRLLGHSSTTILDDSPFNLWDWMNSQPEKQGQVDSLLSAWTCRKNGSKKKSRNGKKKHSQNNSGPKSNRQFIDKISHWSHLCIFMLVTGLEHGFYDFPYIGNFIIPTDLHSIIFQRGRAQPPTSMPFLSADIIWHQ